MRPSEGDDGSNSNRRISEQRKAIIKNADMDEAMQQDAVDIASQALSKYNIEKVILSMHHCGLIYMPFMCC
jgi:hypothetical protein